jgi:hypothetical protein
MYYSSTCSNWQKVTTDTKLFGNDTDLWEPGYAKVVYLQIKNEGTLALKYQLFANIYNEVVGTNVNGNDLKLSQYIQIGSAEVSTAYSNRDVAISSIDNFQSLSGGFEVSAGHLTKKTTASATTTLALVAYMPSTVGVILQATQYTEESDSFGSDYDKNAEYELNLQNNATISNSSVTANVKEDTSTVLTADNGNVTITVPTTDTTGQSKITANITPVTSTSTGVTIQTGSTSAIYDIELLDDKGNKLENLTEPVKIELQIPTGLTDNFAVYHGENELTAATDGKDQTYSYDSTSGKLTIYTTTFSPFTYVSNLFARGLGTKASPYMIKTVQDLQNIDKMDTIQKKLEYPKTIYYKLANNITVPDSVLVDDNGIGTIQNKVIVIRNLRHAVLDGGGYTITGPNTGILFINYMDTATVKNLTCKLNKNSTLAFQVGLSDSSVQSFENVTIDGNLQINQNCGAFTCWSMGTLNFKNCVNKATLNGGGASNNYSAVFAGYAYPNGHKLTMNFDNCVNEGTMICGRAGMFLGNNSANQGKVTINVNNCENKGTIQSTYMEASYNKIWNYYIGTGSNANNTVVLDGVTLDYTNNYGSVTGGSLNVSDTGTFIHGPSNDTLAISKNGDGTFAITKSNQSNVAKYVVEVSLYTTLKTGGTLVQTASETITAERLNQNENTTLQYLPFIYDTDASVQGIEVGDLVGNATVTVDNQTYYLLRDARATLASAKQPQMVSVSAYDSNGVLLSSAPLQ